MMKATVTKWFVVGVVMIVAIYDLAALALWGSGATISRAVGIEASFDSPLIPFALGFVMGHLFWPQKGGKT